jgi:hypothetical protein
MRRIPENREEYFDARNDAYFMPDTYRQGWGQITGQKTQVEVIRPFEIHMQWLGTADPSIQVTADPSIQVGEVQNREVRVIQRTPK